VEVVIFSKNEPALIVLVASLFGNDVLKNTNSQLVPAWVVFLHGFLFIVFHMFDNEASPSFTCIAV
jgi:hypothetical protein